MAIGKDIVIQILICEYVIRHFLNVEVGKNNKFALPQAGSIISSKYMYKLNRKFSVLQTFIHVYSKPIYTLALPDIFACGANAEPLIKILGNGGLF